MDDLIAKCLMGDATDIELRQLDRWRAASPENEREYRALTGLWDRAEEPRIPPVGPRPALELIVREGDARRARNRARAARRAVLRSPWARLGLMAAALATLFFLTLPWYARRGASSHDLFPVASSAAPGDVTTLALSDGSVVRMRPEARVEFPPTVDRREVVLEGIAFFAVAAGPVPFVVRTALGDVTVRGTRFEVRADPGGLRLVVVEGHVRLEAGAGAVDVGQGEVAYLDRGAPPRVADHEDVWSVLDWAGGLLIFEDTPLSMVAEEVARHFGRAVALADPALGQLRITARFEDEPMEEVVAAVCMVAAVPCEIGPAGATVGR